MQFQLLSMLQIKISTPDKTGLQRDVAIPFHQTFSVTKILMSESEGILSYSIWT